MKCPKRVSTSKYNLQHVPVRFVTRADRAEEARCNSILLFTLSFQGAKNGRSQYQIKLMILQIKVLHSLSGLGNHTKYMNSKIEPNTICLWGLPAIYLLIFSQDLSHEISQARQLKTVVNDTKGHGQQIQTQLLFYHEQ